SEEAAAVLSTARVRPVLGRDMHTLPTLGPVAEAGVARPAPSPWLRVAFITHYAELYGANLSMLNLIAGLGRYGVRAHVISPEEDDLLPELARRGIPAAVLPFEWWVSPKRTALGVAARLVRNVRLLGALAGQVARWGCGLVYSNSSVFAI